MSNYSEEKREEHKIKVRNILIRRPNVSIRQIVKVLKSENAELDKDYVNKIVRELDAKRTANLDKYALKSAVASFWERVNETDTYLWQILTDPKQPARDRVMAAREIRLNYKDVLEVMFNAGMFDRKVGKVDINMLDVFAIVEKMEKDKDFRKTLNIKDS